MLLWGHSLGVPTAAAYATSAPTLWCVSSVYPYPKATRRLRRGRGEALAPEDFPRRMGERSGSSFSAPLPHFVWGAQLRAGTHSLGTRRKLVQVGGPAAGSSTGGEQEASDHLSPSQRSAHLGKAETRGDAPGGGWIPFRMSDLGPILRPASPEAQAWRRGGRDGVGA